VAVDFETAFTTLVGCRFPIQLAVMGGGVGTPELALAVSEAGGLGMVSATFPLPVREQLRWVQARTKNPVGVGFFAFDIPVMGEQFEWAASHATVVDVSWGEPDSSVVEQIHEGGALAFWQVGSVDEAKAAADAGCDVVVGQGVEAGGHVRGRTPLFSLLAQIVAAIDVPVLAAGGIATGSQLAAAMNAGAAGARIGTRFLASVESGAHRDYVSALLDATADDTVISTAFSEGWRDVAHRVLRRAIAAAEALPDGIVGQVSYQDRSWQVPRWATQPPSVFTTGAVTAMAMYAGCGVGDISDVPSAAAIVERIAQQARTVLSQRTDAASNNQG
jgi:NAD(P)H-dependent flavin oxidoreductase YrpB (nitropropane dioxygenase family)